MRVGSTALGIFTSQDGSEVYVPEVGFTVEVIDVKTDKVVRKLRFPDIPAGAMSGPDGNLYVAARGSGNVISIAQDGQAHEASIQVTGDANRMGVAQAGRSNTAELAIQGSGNDWTVEQAGRGLAIRIRRDGDAQPLAVHQSGP